MIKKIGVIGAGTMGHGIAESFAMFGYSVKLFDINKAQLEKALAEIRSEQQLLVDEQFITESEAAATLQNITIHDCLQEAVQDRDYVIEASPEILELKKNLFKQLDEFCPAETIFASNTSSLSLNPMMELVGEARRERMMVCHWYNPGHLMPLVELSFFGNMPTEIYQQVESLYASINKQTIKVLKDVPGLVANRIQQGVAREAFSLIEQGIASPADVDRALKFGPAFRYATTGQLEVADFGGLDIWCIVGDNLLPAMDNSVQANALLRQKVAEGKLGIKSGEGFFCYSSEQIPEIKKQFARKLIHQLKASKFYT